MGLWAALRISYNSLEKSGCCFVLEVEKRMRLSLRREGPMNLGALNQLIYVYLNFNILQGFLCEVVRLKDVDWLDEQYMAETD